MSMNNILYETQMHILNEMIIQFWFCSDLDKEFHKF